MRYLREKVTKADFEKMLAYADKGSDPDRLAASIKTLDKAINRYCVARVFGWQGAEFTLEHRAKDLGATDDDLEVAYDDMCQNTALVTMYCDKFDDLKNNGAGHISMGVDSKRSLPQKLDKWLRENGIKYSMKLRNGTRQEVNYMSNNGRAWPMSYDVTLYKNGNSFIVKYCVYTNEGGGSPYGYMLDETFYLTQDLLLNGLKRFVEENF